MVDDAPSPDSGRGVGVGPPRSQLTRSSRQATGMMVRPGTSPASAALAAGTTRWVSPASAAAIVRVRTSGTGRTAPSRPSSPISAVAVSRRSGTAPMTSSVAAAAARSMSERGCAVEAVRRTTPSGHDRPLLRMAARTRSRVSRETVEFRPCTRSVASPTLRSARMSTIRVWESSRVTTRVRASMASSFQGGERRSGARKGAGVGVFVGCATAAMEVRGRCQARRARCGRRRRVHQRARPGRERSRRWRRC